MLAMLSRSGTGKVTPSTAGIVRLTLRGEALTCQRIRNAKRDEVGRWIADDNCEVKIIAVGISSATLVNSPLRFASEQTRDRHYIYRQIFCNLFRASRWSIRDHDRFAS